MKWPEIFPSGGGRDLEGRGGMSAAAEAMCFSFLLRKERRHASFPFLHKAEP